MKLQMGKGRRGITPCGGCSTVELPPHRGSRSDSNRHHAIIHNFGPSNRKRARKRPWNCPACCLYTAADYSAGRNRTATAGLSRTHDLRPAKKPTDKKRTGNERALTTELPRHLEPKAGFEPATTRLGGDNPILRPVENSSLPFVIFMAIAFGVFIFTLCP